jgi:hypothetical protein
MIEFAHDLELAEIFLAFSKGLQALMVKILVWNSHSGQLQLFGYVLSFTLALVDLVMRSNKEVLLVKVFEIRILMTNW